MERVFTKEEKKDTCNDAHANPTNFLFDPFSIIQNILPLPLKKIKNTPPISFTHLKKSMFYLCTWLYLTPIFY